MTNKKLTPTGKKPTAKLTRMQALGKELQKSYGARAAVMGSEKPPLDVISTGSLALDFELGTGGWPRGHASGVWGKRDIGKSVIALRAVANAQAQGLNCAWIAVEPTFDAEWAQMHGVDTDDLLVLFPKTGEDAFHMLYQCIDYEADMVVFDSIGALLGETEIGEEANARSGGQAALITWGMKMCVPAAYHANTALMMLNQQRADRNARYAGAMQQPGGEALEHLEAIIMHLKAGGTAFKIKQRGQDVEIGKPVLAHIQRNKLSQGSSRKATYDMYYMETENYPFGIDLVADAINTGKRTGVIGTAGAYFDLPLPNGETKRVQGALAVAQSMADDPTIYDEVRKQVLAVMAEKYGKAENLAKPLEVA